MRELDAEVDAAGQEVLRMLERRSAGRQAG